MAIFGRNHFLKAIDERVLSTAVVGSISYIQAALEQTNWFRLASVRMPEPGVLEVTAWPRWWYRLFLPELRKWTLEILQDSVAAGIELRLVFRWRLPSKAELAIEALENEAARG